MEDVNDTRKSAVPGRPVGANISEHTNSSCHGFITFSLRY